MNRQLIIFDKDGTLTEPKSGEPFVQHPLDQQPIPGAAEAVRHFHGRGFPMVVASNQGGVASGHKSLDEAISEMRFCLELFPEIEFGVFSPDYEGRVAYLVWRDRSEQVPQPKDLLNRFGHFRKPGPGMIHLILCQYARRFNPSRSDIWVIGDRPEDEGAAVAAGCNYLAADIIRDRFRPGVYQIDVNLAALELLEPSIEGRYHFDS